MDQWLFQGLLVFLARIGEEESRSTTTRRVMPTLNASELKKKWLRTALIVGDQSVKLVLDPEKLGPSETSGFPQDVYMMFPSGIPLDLLTSMPLDIDYDTDPIAFTLRLSFNGLVKTCRVPWKAIAVIGIGIGGIPFQHDTDREVPPPRPGLRLV